MATRSTRNGTMKCGLCDADIDEHQYRTHVAECGLMKICALCGKQVQNLATHYERCTGGDNTANDAYKTRQKPSPPPIRQYTPPYIPNRKNTKECAMCSRIIAEADYADHVDACSGRPPTRPMNTRNTKECPMCSKMITEDDYADHVDVCGTRPPTRPMKKKNTKECAICSKMIAENDYVDHVDVCGTRLPTRSMNTRNTKECDMCSKMIAENDYADHVDACSGRLPRRSMNTKNTKECAMCSKMIAEADYADHVDACSGRPSTRPMNTRNTKECPMCSKVITEDDYADHVDVCGNRPPTRPMNIKKTQECIICFKQIEAVDYNDHVNVCLNQKPVQPKNTKECIICYKTIAEIDYTNHVNKCLAESCSSSKPKSTFKPTQNTCFTCSSPVNSSKNSSHVIPCRSSHIYCLKCLQRSMNDYIQSNTAPVCHSNLCDYELSRYDVACLPLEADIIQRLLTCVKNTQRSQCPLCLFYVDFNTMDDLQKHAASCDSENLIPCEYCHCLFNKPRRDAHSQQCRDIPHSQQQQALADFILPRTKYPVTGPQLRIFLEHRRKNRLPLDPHSIVNSLAEFGAVFPFDVPTRDCDVCMESCIYDDIFVFDCKESHKLCYGCFENSCTAKMNSNEVLTCAVCTHQLQDGEIKQLRIPADRKRQFLEYQMQKTFSTYSDGTQGVIKCPNQGCKWIAEAQNPNDRFQITCPLCNYKFCSLCSQQYHFRTTCQQMPEITQRWFFWCNTERGNYWQARAQQDASFRAQLEDYQRQAAASTQRNAELRQRYDELLADETFKAQNCRLCPNCKRVVQYLSGCDSMVCGRNYHGGDQQSGCGHGFKWSTAPPYVPMANTGPQQVRNDMPSPEQQKTVVHEGVQCDACHNALQGIRFDCVHCSSLIFCEKCEQRATLEHSNQIRDQKKQQHVFILSTKPLNG